MVCGSYVLVMSDVLYDRRGKENLSFYFVSVSSLLKFHILNLRLRVLRSLDMAI